MLRRPPPGFLAAILLLTSCSAGPVDSRPAATTGAGADRSSAASSTSRVPSTYVALGDSVAAGAGADRPRVGGYVPLLADLLRQRMGCAGPRRCPLVARNLAVGGATTATVLQDQVPALQALAARTASSAPVRLVTLTAGGNDVFGPTLASCARAPLGPGCAAAAASAVAAAGRGVEVALDAVGRAAPGATVVVTAYYDPLPACRLASLSPLAVRVLEGDSTRPGLNDLIRAAAAAHDAVVVETRELLTERADLVGGDDCLHPSGRGHEKIAAALNAAVGPLVSGA